MADKRQDPAGIFPVKGAEDGAELEGNAADARVLVRVARHFRP